MSFKNIVTQLLNSKTKIHISHSGSASKAKLANSIIEEGRDVIVVAKNQDELSEIKSLIHLFASDYSYQDNPLDKSTWQKQILHFQAFSLNLKARLNWAGRIDTLYSLILKNRKRIILLVAEDFLPMLPPKDFFDGKSLYLEKGSDMLPEYILEQLIEWGYSRVSMVSSPGEVAVRGDILDIFTPGYEKPVRLEFFGDTIDDVRIFDPISQRSIADLVDIVILPTSFFRQTEKSRKELKSYWKNLISQKSLDPDDLWTLERTLEKDPGSILPGMLFSEKTSLMDWLPKEGIWILPDEGFFKEQLQDCYKSWEDKFEENYKETGLNNPVSEVIAKPEQLLSSMDMVSKVFFEDFGKEDTYPLTERKIHSFQELFPSSSDLERPWQRLVAAMKVWGKLGSQNQKDELPKSEYKQVILSFSNERSRAKFLDLARQDSINPHLRLSANDTGIFALVSDFRSGCTLPWASTLVLGEDVIQPRSEKTQRRKVSGAFKGLDRHDTLKEGDFLVHRDYGVGLFGGLHRMDLGGVENDYFLILYAEKDKLYLPVDRLALIQEYKAPDGISPVLDKLGSNLWLASKDKAKKAIEKIAEDLVQMYAFRKVAKGFTYKPAGEMYREFEASFGFEETPDQASAIEDVLSDMEKPEPMDRLICGDVGFGKTEVALRAAFRAVLEGRQVAMLCPTTILAEQHFQTFKARLAAFPVNVALLSRFVTPKKQKKTLEAAAKGQVDVVIGTHRLLSKDVVLPKLGLLVLDEEQKFGVRHKERLKELKKNVDVLTLSATPIPRTLQLSLSGIRELSLIETAPPERKSVVSTVINREDGSLRSILERELERKGQVFWVYNRVQGLERVAEYVQKLVPGAKVGIAHGQMSERALEDSMYKFWRGETEVLVCTSIIESGLDFPNANTLIVDHAHMFGLGQLYQLRGRVGRSDRQAYAVFTVSNIDKINDIARQRLRVIQEMDYLGAGFQVAMEDLRLRGAGNILGEVQTGHMTRLGLELFLEMLEYAVAKLKGTPLAEEFETEITLGIPAHIPESYIADAQVRLKYYKALSTADSSEKQQEIELEMRDRFGLWPEIVGNFLAILIFKRFLASMGVLKADLHSEQIKLNFLEKNNLDSDKLVKLVTRRSGEMRFLPPLGLEIKLNKGKAVEVELVRIQDILNGLKKA